LTIALGAALILLIVGVYFVRQAPRRADQSKLVVVDCLQVERGPTLRFAGGVLQASGAPVGTYEFLPAVAGKHGPRIQVRGVAVHQTGERIVVTAGNQAWFWPFQNDDTVEIFYYPQNRTLAHRCTS
jgi:hypothetical protein